MKYLLLFFITLAACKKKQVEDKMDVLTMKEMSDLATVEYTITKVIKATDDKTWYKIGNRKILMSCEATIKAGIDMSGITEKNFSIKEKSIRVRLPEPKIISLNIPAEKIKVEYEEATLLRDEFTSKDRDVLTSQAELQIKNSIESLGILNQAKVNTSSFVESFLRKLGYESIYIEYHNSYNPLIQ